MRVAFSLLVLGTVFLVGCTENEQSATTTTLPPTTSSTTTTAAPTTTGGEAEPEAPPEAIAPFAWLDVIDLPGSPMGMAHDAENDAIYVTLAEGDIVRIEWDGEALGVPEVVATEIRTPRGVALEGSSLYVVEMGDLPCPPLECKGDKIAAEGEDPFVAEIAILEASRSNILEFEILDDGTLSEPTVLVADLPIANRDHAVNGLSIGPDGSLYASIGHVDALIYLMEDFIANANPALLGTDRVVFPGSELEGVDHPNLDLLGTVIRVDTETGDFFVATRGIRNIYEITHDDLGVLWGVDNDGFAIGSWRREEIVRLRLGADFGFPEDGSSAPFEVRTDPAVWVLDNGIAGAGGVEFISDVDEGQGLLVGTVAELWYLELKATYDGSYTPFNHRQAFRLASPSAGYVLSIEGIGDQAAAVAEYGPNRLRVLSWAPIPEPATTP